MNFQASNNLDGVVLITPAGVSASITVGNLTGALTLPVTIAGSAVIQVNTSATAVDLTPDGGAQVKLPAGPYLRISVGNGINPVLTVGTVEFRGNVTIERSTRSGFTSTSLTVTSNETALAVGDLNKDGRPDLVIGTTGGYTVLLGSATTSAGNPDTVGYAAPGSAAALPSFTQSTAAVALADVDNDGWLDVVLVGGGATGTTTVLRNKGLNDGTATPATTWQGFTAAVTGLGSANAAAVALGDLTGDGYADLVIAGSGGTKYYAATSASSAWTGFATTATSISSTTANDVVLGDFDNNTTLDVFIASTAGDLLYRNSAPGTTPRTLTAYALATPSSSRFAVAGDLNGDNLLDVVAADGTNAPVVYYNKGLNDGTTTPATSWQGFAAPAAVPGGALAATHLRPRATSTATAASTWWRARQVTPGCSATTAAPPRCVPASRRRGRSPARPAPASPSSTSTPTPTPTCVSYGGSGSRLFQQQPVSTTIIGLAGVSVSLGDADGVSIQDGQGALILFGGTGTAAGVAGTFSGSISAGGAGVSVGASGRCGSTAPTARWTRSSRSAAPSILVHFGTGETYGNPTAGKPFVQIAGKGSIKIGDFIELVGGFTSGGGVITITDGTLFVGQGPRLLDDGSPNPNAKGLLITGVNASIGSDNKLDATGTVSLIGIPGLTFTGTVHVKGTKGATGAGSSVVAGNLVLGVDGAFSLDGSFSFGYTAATATDPAKLTMSVGTRRHRPAERPDRSRAQAQHGCGLRRPQPGRGLADHRQPVHRQRRHRGQRQRHGGPVPARREPPDLLRPAAVEHHRHP